MGGSPEIVFERLLPGSGTAVAPELLADVRPADRAPADRPRVLVNMVATADGRAAVRGRSGAIGGPGDARMFAELRAIAEAVLVGTETLRAERYGRLVKDPGRRARRVASGLSADPLLVLFSRALDLPWDAPVFAEPAQAVVVACAQDASAPVPRTAAPVSLLRLREPTVGATLRALRAGHGVRSLLCEGGPTLNALLLAEGLIDELFLTVAPVLAGEGDAPGIIGETGLAEPARLELVWLLRHGGELFLRYQISVTP